MGFREWWQGKPGSGRGVDFKAGARPSESRARAVPMETDKPTTRFGKPSEIPVIQGCTTDPKTQTIEPAYNCREKYPNIEVKSGRVPQAEPYQIDRSNEAADW